MPNPEEARPPDYLVDYLVVSDQPGRQFLKAGDTRWGGLVRPDPSEVPDSPRGGLRVVLFASWEFGYLVLETLKEYARRFPGRLDLAGLATDDPLNPDAKISFKKRVWGLLDLPHRVVDETCLIEAGLSCGMPVYTGEVKTESFRGLLRSWNPDAVLVCVFGQILDSRIIDLPPYGIYNFHPSDLARGHGAGPAPYDDLAARRAATSLWSVHRVTEGVDSGPIVGQSPPVNVLDGRGALPADPLVVYEKLAEVLSPLAFLLVDGLCRRRARGEPGPIGPIDFAGLIPQTLKDRLLRPVADDLPSQSLPRPDLSLFP